MKNFGGICEKCNRTWIWPATECNCKNIKMTDKSDIKEEIFKLVENIDNISVVLNYLQKINLFHPENHEFRKVVNKVCQYLYAELCCDLNLIKNKVLEL